MSTGLGQNKYGSQNTQETDIEIPRAVDSFPPGNVLKGISPEKCVHANLLTDHPLIDLAATPVSVDMSISGSITESHASMNFTGECTSHSTPIQTKVGAVGGAHGSLERDQINEEESNSDYTDAEDEEANYTHMDKARQLRKPHKKMTIAGKN